MKENSNGSVAVFTVIAGIVLVFLFGIAGAFLTFFGYQAYDNYKEGNKDTFGIFMILIVATMIIWLLVI